MGGRSTRSSKVMNDDNLSIKTIVNELIYGLVVLRSSNLCHQFLILSML